MNAHKYDYTRMRVHRKHKKLCIHSINYNCELVYLAQHLVTMYLFRASTSKAVQKMPYSIAEVDETKRQQGQTKHNGANHQCITQADTYSTSGQKMAQR